MRSERFATADALSRKLPPDARMDLLVGTWALQGRQLESPFGPALRISAKETFEWLEGRHFLIHRFNGMLGEAPMACVEMLGKERVHSFYNDGRKIIWASRFEDHHWLISGWWITEHEPVQVRCTTHFVSDKQRSAVWERSTDGTTWRIFWEVTAWKVGVEA